jgi:hypothetical protein
VRFAWLPQSETDRIFLRRIVPLKRMAIEGHLDCAIEVGGEAVAPSGCFGQDVRSLLLEPDTGSLLVVFVDEDNAAALEGAADIEVGAELRLSGAALEVDQRAQADEGMLGERLARPTDEGARGATLCGCYIQFSFLKAFFMYIMSRVGMTEA